jgi:hypothetical protein
MNSTQPSAEAKHGAGDTYVDPGYGHMHIGRNEETVPLEILVTYVVSGGPLPRSERAVARIRGVDADRPAARRDVGGRVAS